jgi:excisionase family DNA binding protein
MNATASNLSFPAQSCVTRFELAQVLHVSVRTVDRMIAAGEIRVRRVRGKAVRFMQSDVERYLEGEANKISTPHPTPSPPAPLPSDGRGWRRTLPGRGGEEINQTRDLKPTKPTKMS